MRLRRRGTTATATATSSILVTVPLGVMATLIIIEVGALLEVVVAIMGTSSAMISAVVAPIVLETPIVLMRTCRHGRRGGRRIALVGSWRVRRGRLVRVIRLWRIASAHWSNGIARRPVVKPHPNGRTHGLGLGLVVVSSTPSSSTKLLGR